MYKFRITELIVICEISFLEYVAQREHLHAIPWD
jgi:hypothetical protein